MASSQSVPDEAAWRQPQRFLPAEPIQAAKLLSQSRKWLTERIEYLPQVRLVFGEELPQSIKPNENYEGL
jgi:hypothetical protein